ncbi:MAG: helix-hairpin-helix domain-containing protein [Pseudomonadota bacterium]
MDTVGQPVDDRQQVALTYLRQMRAARTDLQRLRRARRFLPVPAPGRTIVSAEVTENDLADIAGVGPGLIWALGHCGIHTRAGLAQADADTLRAGLGPVGTMLNVADLQARASL